MQPTNYQPNIATTGTGKYASRSADLMYDWTGLVLPAYEKGDRIIFEYKADSVPKSHPYSVDGVDALKDEMLKKGFKENEIEMTVHGSSTLMTIPLEAIKRVSGKPKTTGWGLFLEKTGLKRSANGDMYRVTDPHAPLGFHDTSLPPDANIPEGADAISIGDGLRHAVKKVNKHIEWHFVHIDADQPLWYADAGASNSGRELAKQINSMLIRAGLESTVEKIRSDHYIVSVPVSKLNVEGINRLEESLSIRISGASQGHTAR